MKKNIIEENYFSVIYSDNMVNWYDSTNYQFEELNKALIFFKNNPNLSYKLAVSTNHLKNGIFLLKK